MSHQDLKVAVQGVKGDCLARAIKWLLSGMKWEGIQFRRDCTWTPALLVAGAMLWAWCGEPTLKERFQWIRKIIHFLFAVQREIAGSYQAFTKMLRCWTKVLVPQVQENLRTRIQQELPDCWGLHGFVLFGVDGSRIDLPRTASNQKVYSANRKSKQKKSAVRKYGQQNIRKSNRHRKADAPQSWLTMMWHIGSSLPWNWRTGPADSSERAHMVEMLESLPADALVVADAGFVGYEYWKAILESGRQFVIRVGSNVRMLRQLGYTRENEQTVYLWPDKAAKKNSPPLVLRLIVIQNGKHPVYLVTSVCSVNRLSDRQLTDIYRSRWGLEVYYRHLKQTFNRRKLRSMSPDIAGVELEWSLVGLWAMGLYTLLEAHHVGTSPKKISPAQMLLAFRSTMRDYRHPQERGESLCQQLRRAIIDSYVRKNKVSRNYPRKKQEKPPGSPIITDATPQQIAKAQEVLAT